MYNNINMAIYEQMGFTKQQVSKAFEYSQKNNVDIFDALQYLQKRQNDNIKTGPMSPPPKNPSPLLKPQGSILYPFKNVNLNDFEIIFSKKTSRMNLPGKRVDLRQQFSPVGLLNVYNCCYLNSLLQCYFLSSHLIKYIFEAEPLSSLQMIQSKKNQVKTKRIQNQYNLLHTLKQIFSKMCLTSKKYIDPTQVLRNLVDSVGQKIQFGQQKDLFETNILIIERLNQCLLYTKKYFKPQAQNGNQENNQKFMSTNSNGKPFINQSKINQRDNIKRLFYGQKVQFTDSNHNKKDGQHEILSDFLGIIINPAHQNLYKALYEQFHYEVQMDMPEQKRKIKTKKHTYIREVPQYLYFYINRTGYNAQQKQALKNQQKLSFDFVIYLDSFMEKYKEQSAQKNQQILNLWRKKNLLQKKRNSFEIFAKKLQQCRHLAQAIQGWKQKLPQQQDIDSQKQSIDKQLKSIEQQLEKIQSRKEKYCLMYIFVHRGDAVSGHYWGYGRNAESWYKFDINTNQMKQEQILLDLYKCGGTPYALVYVKQENLPKINYQYYKNFNVVNDNLLIDMNQNQKESQNPYISLVPQGLKKVIIAQNIQLHQEYTKRRNLQITTKVVKEYLTRFNWIQNQAQEVSKKSQNSFKVLPSYDNFSIYLWTKNQVQLAKYNIFSVSLKNVANMSTQQLMEDQILLNSVQKQFRKKAKKNKALKHFCIEFQPQQGQKYVSFYNNYLYEKQSFLVLLKLINFIQIVDDSQKQKNLVSQQVQQKINKILRRIAMIIKHGSKNNSYIKHILSQLTSVFILRVVRAKCILKLNEQETNLLMSSNLIKQIQILGLKECLVIQNRNCLQKEYMQSKKKNQKNQQLWMVEQLGKGPNRQILQKKFSPAMQLTRIQVSIIKRLSKQNKYSKFNSKDGNIQDYNESDSKKIQQSDSLI